MPKGSPLAAQSVATKPRRQRSSACPVSAWAKVKIMILLQDLASSLIQDYPRPQSPRSLSLAWDKANKKVASFS